ncbi:hypothetical protein [Candidatus Ichthyocystis hellenicum]|uniref:hypothetical protein n=1 Tax=Candidatus Ichthyocystis hellenicum TaxID=1561003 RepID=UPI000B84EA26|nr:hypothetical protein [Candidatus Ichthyocystis hellenicum]
MNINPNINTAAQSTQGQSPDEMMTKLSQILANSGASADSGSEVRNEDLALKETLSMAIQQQMGEPEAPAVDDEHKAAMGLTSGLASEGNFQALMAKVMSVLIKSSSEQSAGRREQRAIEASQGLKNSLDAVEELKSGAAQAFATSMISSGLSLGMSVGGMAASVKSMKANAQATDLKNQASKLQNPEMVGLATASDAKLAAKPTDVAESGAGSIDGLKENLLNQARQKDAHAQKLSLTADALGKVGGTTGSVGAAIASAQMSQATAAQAEEETFARRDQAEGELAAEWQNRMASVRDQMLQIVQEVNRANAASQSSAFQNM